MSPAGQYGVVFRHVACHKKGKMQGLVWGNTYSRLKNPVNSSHHNSIKKDDWEDEKRTEDDSYNSHLAWKGGRKDEASRKWTPNKRREKRKHICGYCKGL